MLVAQAAFRATSSHSGGVQLASMAGECSDLGIGSPPFGNVNCDGVIDEFDFTTILQIPRDPRTGGSVLAFHQVSAES